MSNILYLECLDHDPSISSDEVGHHLSDLPEVRKMIAERKFYEDLMGRDLPVSFDYSTTHSCAVFLSQHPHCRIGICDEYDRRYPVEPEEKE